MRALIEDVNNKPGQHEAKNGYWSGAGVHVIRSKLPYGDYMEAPAVVVDTKRDLYELIANLTVDHRRFREAADKARRCGTRLVILTENEEGVSDLYDLADWMEPEGHYRQRVRMSKGRVKLRYKGSTYYKTCRTMEREHGLRFEFCAPDEAGRRVLEILNGDANDEDSESDTDDVPRNRVPQQA